MKLFKKSAKCIYESQNSDCSLIQNLKSLQASKKEIDQQIDAYKHNRSSLVTNFINFLNELENNGCFMYCRSSVIAHCDESGVDIYFRHNGTGAVENALKKLSLNDISKICDELKALAYRSDIIQEKTEISNRLAEEIKNIKDTLGIE